MNYRQFRDQWRYFIGPGMLVILVGCTLQLGPAWSAHLRHGQTGGSGPFPSGGYGDAAPRISHHRPTPLLHHQLPGNRVTPRKREPEVGWKPPSAPRWLRTSPVRRNWAGSTYQRSSTRLSLARSAATAAPSALNSASVMPGRRRTVNTTSEPVPSAITLIGT